MKTVANLSSEQAYCLDQMGISRWQTPINEHAFVIHRPVNPWQTPHTDNAHDSLEQSDVFSHEISSKQTRSDGFSPAQVSAKIDSASQNKTVAGLKQELEAEAGVIVEDLQPIEELSVAIEPAPVIVEGLPQQLHCFSLLIENKLLILSDVPMGFHDNAEIEKLALKMAQALLKQALSEWQSGTFNWPGQLRNPFFDDRSDWLLGALESHIEARLGESHQDKDAPLSIVLAGQNIQKVFAEIANKPQFIHTKQTEIVSLPQLYRIPELKADAWKALQSLIV